MPHTKTLSSCRLCKSSRIKFLLKKDDVYIFKCFDCRVIFLGNDLDEDAVKDLYKYYSPTGFSNYLSPITKIRYEKLLDSFERYRKNNTLLDVGCGAGYFMLSASSRGWEAEGTEISGEAVRLAEEKGQKALKGDIAVLDLEKDKYDIATLFELLEHTSNPEGIIKKLSYILRPSGAIYITTPNYNCLTRRFLGNHWSWFHKEHQFYFTSKTLRGFLKKYGFRIKRLRTENLSLIEISKIFNGHKPFDFARGYEKQERIRALTEEKLFFSVMKRLANFILNLFGIGDTIYILAVRS